MISCVIFDLDGTLVDSLPGIAAALNLALKAHHFPEHSLETVRSFVGDGLEMLIRRATPKNAELNSLISCFKENYAETWAGGTVPYPGIEKILHALQQQNIPLAVLSNKTHSFTEEIALAVFPDIRFGKVLGQRSGMPPKPDPAGALEIAASLGISPENCVLVGDSTIDLETARNAGMQAIAVSWGYHDLARLQKEAGKVSILSSPEDVFAEIS